MKKLVWTPHFVKSTEKFTKNFPEYIELFKEKIKLLEVDVFNPSLKTHKLKGNLTGFYACSINYTYRIIFQFDKNENLILINIGTHDEAY